MASPGREVRKMETQEIQISFEDLKEIDEAVARHRQSLYEAYVRGYLDEMQQQAV
jgi:hypothetical protein